MLNGAKFPCGNPRSFRNDRGMAGSDQPPRVQGSDVSVAPLGGSARLGASAGHGRATEIAVPMGRWEKYVGHL